MLGPVSRVANTTNMVPVLREGASSLQEEKDIKQIAASIYLYIHTYVYMYIYIVIKCENADSNYKVGLSGKS